MALFSVRYCLILSQIRKNSKIIVRIRRDFVVGVSMMYDKRLKKQDSIINVGVARPKGRATPNIFRYYYGNTAQMPQSALYNRCRIKTVDNL